MANYALGETFDLGRILQTAAVLKNEQQQSQTDALRQKYLGMQIAGAQQSQQTQLQNDQALRSYHLADVVLGAKDPIAAAQSVAPNFVQDYEQAHGAGSFSSLTPDQVRQMAMGLKQHAESIIGPQQKVNWVNTGGSMTPVDSVTGQPVQGIPALPITAAPAVRAADTRAAASLAETTRHNKAMESGQQSSILSPAGANLMAEAITEGVKIPTGSRSSKMISTAFNTLALNHPDKTPQEIIGMIRTGQISMAGLMGQTSVIAKREGNIAASIQALTRPGGIFAQLDSAASDVDFGSAKFVNGLRLAAQGHVVADPKVQRYVNLINDARAEAASVLARSGQVTDVAREMAAEQFPYKMSYPELRTAIQTMTSVAGAVGSGNVDVMNALKSGKTIAEVAAAAAGVSQPAPETGRTQAVPSVASFASESEAQAAANDGKIKRGDRITVNGIAGTWQ